MNDSKQPLTLLLTQCFLSKKLSMRT